MTAFVLMACHNRRELTVSSLAALYMSSDFADIDIKVTLYDDGSSDGTAHAVRTRFPDVRVLSGDGSSFWAKSMQEAESSVLRDDSVGDGDYLMWLNDDVILDQDAMSRIEQLHRENPRNILSCATRDPDTSRITYSGMRFSGKHPLSFRLVEPSALCVQVDTFNGNIVVVPAQVALKVGGIDGCFAHALADIDYGLRAGRGGIATLLAPLTFGTCPRNPPRPDSGILSEWRDFVAPKGGGHPASMIRFLRRHSPTYWPVFLSGTYCLWWVRASAKKLRSVISGRMVNT